MSQLLSKLASSDKHGEASPYFDGWKAYDNNPYHPTHNPHGVIQMGLAENQVRLLNYILMSSLIFCLLLISFLFNFIYYGLLSALFRFDQRMDKEKSTSIYLHGGGN